MKYKRLYAKKMSVLLKISLIIMIILFSFISVKSQITNQNENDFSEIIHHSLVDDHDREIFLPYAYDYISDPYVLDFGDDGILETVVIAYSTSLPSRVYLIRNENIVVNGWPVELGWDINDIEVVGKIGLNGGTKPAVVIRWDKAIDNTTVITSFFAITADGNIDPIYGFQLNGSFIENTIFEDINNDGEKEYVLIRNDEYVFYLNQDGTNKTNWPIQVNETIVFNKPVVEDITGDNELDIVVVTDAGLIFAWHQNGTLITDFPFRIPMHEDDSEKELREKPIIADLNNDGSMELAVASVSGYFYVVTLNPPNNQSWMMKIPENVLYKDGTAFDINNDGIKEIVHTLSSGLLVLRLDEELEQVFFFQRETGFFGSPAIADLNRDNEAEIVVANYGRIYIVKNNGNLVRQFTRYTSSPSVYRQLSPLIYDFDNDQEIEVIELTSNGVIYILETNDFGVAPWIYELGSTTNALNKDSDDDKLWDFEEEIIGTNKNLNDTDGDTVTDGMEINQYVLDPFTSDLDTDSDMDGLTNIEEIDVHKSDPLDFDTDGDSLNDGDEVEIYFTSPILQDTDSDGLPDNYEVLYDVLDPNDPTDATEDPDEDNLNNRDERSWGTSPENPDSDSDGLLDGDEAKKYFTDPNTPDADADHDGDGLTNVEEVDIYHTNPSSPDTDGDGYNDFLEVTQGSDPLDPESIPTKGTSFMHPILIALSLASVVVMLRVINRRRSKKE